MVARRCCRICGLPRSRRCLQRWSFHGRSCRASSIRRIGGRSSRCIGSSLARDRVGGGAGEVAGGFLGAQQRRRGVRVRRYIDKSCHTDDEAIEGAVPAVRRGDRAADQAAVLRAAEEVAGEPIRGGIEGRKFAVLERNWGADVEVFREENVPLETEVTKLVTEYDEICGAMMVNFRGQELTLAAGGEAPGGPGPRDATGGVGVVGGAAVPGPRADREDLRPTARAARTDRAERGAAGLSALHLEGVQAVRLLAGAVPGVRRRDRSGRACRWWRSWTGGGRRSWA